MSALANQEFRPPKVGERYLYSGFEYEVLRIDQAVVTIRGVNAKRQSDIPLLRWQDLAARGRMTALVEHAEWQDLYRNAANLTDKEATTHQRRLAYVQAFERELLGRAPTELGLLLIKRVAEERSEHHPPSPAYGSGFVSIEKPGRIRWPSSHESIGLDSVSPA